MACGRLFAWRGWRGRSPRCFGCWRPASPASSCPAHPSENGTIFAAAVPGGVFRMEVGQRGQSGGDAELQCAVLPDDPNPLDPPWLDLDLRLAVDEPRVMFRPHIDWYTVEHGPNWRPLQNAHNSATRMLSIQTPRATVSMVPDTDNLTWGFTSDHQMTAVFQIPLAPHDPLQQGIWRPIAQAPSEFRIAIPVRKGDWWDAFRHVVTDVFQFEEPRQWPMPITQMQMLTTRALMSYGAWSERWQMVRAYSNDSVLWTFYGAVYSLPALYNWYLATDDPTAKIKAEKIVEWLLRVQHQDGPDGGGVVHRLLRQRRAGTGGWRFHQQPLADPAVDRRDRQDAALVLERQRPQGCPRAGRRAPRMPMAAQDAAGRRRLAVCL